MHGMCVCVYGSGLVELCGLSECEWYAWHVCVCVYGSGLVELCGLRILITFQ